MFNGYKLIDADGHVVEPIDIWEEYIEPEFKRYAPTRNSSFPTKEKILSVLTKNDWKAVLPNPVQSMRVEGEEIANKISEELWKIGTWQMLTNYTEPALNNFSASSQIKVMDQLGIDIAFLYPTVGLWILAIDSMEKKLAGALTRAYNNWLRDFCCHNPQRLKGIGAINRHNPEEMVPEVRRIAEFGWKAVFLRPNPIKGRILSDPAYEPFWTECERLDIAVSIHEGSHCKLPSAGAERFNTRFALHACSHPMEQMMAMLALLEGGVLERHPRLRVAFLEAGCGWLPYWLWRLDELEYGNLAWEVKDNLKMKPSEYFRRQCFISFEPDEPYLAELIKFIGEDNLLFGSDYPHMDHHPDITQELMKLENHLPKQTIQKILWDNPCRFYGLESEQK